MVPTSTSFLFHFLIPRSFHISYSLSSLLLFYLMPSHLPWLSPVSTSSPQSRSRERHTPLCAVGPGRFAILVIVRYISDREFPLPIVSYPPVVYFSIFFFWRCFTFLFSLLFFYFSFLSPLINPHSPTLPRDCVPAQQILSLNRLSAARSQPPAHPRWLSASSVVAGAPATPSTLTFGEWGFGTMRILVANKVTV